MLKVVVVVVVVVVSAKVQIKKQLFSRLFVSKGQKVHIQLKLSILVTQSSNDLCLQYLSSKHSPVLIDSIVY